MHRAKVSILIYLESIQTQLENIILSHTEWKCVNFDFIQTEMIFVSLFYMVFELITNCYELHIITSVPNRGLFIMDSI